MDPHQPPQESPATDGLSENHQRHLRIMFQMVDEELTEILRLLDPTGAQSPFSEYIADATPVQYRVVADYAAQIRSQMRKILEEHNVALPKRHISSIWAARAHLLSAGIHVEELRPEHMRGYGDLSETAQHDMTSLVAGLTDTMDHVEAYLAQGAGHDLKARLNRLPATNDTVTVLQELERVITNRGLVAFRPIVAMLLERLETNQYEVAVFGRVSSGKSSLLNYFLQTSALPVGVTPVTAVPIRILHGRRARAIVSFAEAGPQVIELTRVAEYVTEQQNPSNAKHVTRVIIEVPSARLEEGIVFVDTPGLGALANSGAAESLAYLPRCDLGIVLVDASSTLTQEDLTVVDALRHAGADVIVLLSKADLLSPEDRRRVADYATSQIRANIGADVDVHLVSVAEGERQLADQWFESVLVPKLRSARSLAAASIRHKVTALREGVLAVLRGRTVRESSTARASHNGSPEATAKVFSSLLAQLDTARRESVEASDRASELTDRLVDHLTREIIAAWKKRPDSPGDIREIAENIIRRFFTNLAAGVAKDLLTLRSSLTDALSQASATSAFTNDMLTDLPAPAGLPMMDTSAIASHLQVHPPTLGFLAPRVRSHGIRKQVESSIAADACKAIRLYGKQLDEWRLRYLLELRKAFTAATDLHGVEPVRVSSAESPQGDSGLLQDIQRLETIGRDMQQAAKSKSSGISAS